MQGVMASRRPQDQQLVTRTVRQLYQRWLRAYVRDPITQQRLKLAWFVWGYHHLLGARALTVIERLTLIARFARIDWHVEHAHTPEEISHVCLAILARRAEPGDLVIEAGCWRGGSSAKFSLACRAAGYSLQVYDSFAGVEALAPAEIGGGYDFSGTYAAGREVVEANVARFGAPEICSFHQGWFSETLAARPLSQPVSVAYIDCDLAKGTREALSGILPSLVAGGSVFSQDYHIEPVQRLLHDPALWARFDKPMPRVQQLTSRLARLSFSPA